MNVNWIFSVLTLWLVIASPATAQLGGLMRNGEAYWSLELTSGNSAYVDAGGADLRLAWGNDFDGMTVEVGLASVSDLAGANQDGVVLDVSMLSESQWDDVEFEWGLAIEGYNPAANNSLGLAVVFQASLRETPEPWDPYMLLRVRRDGWNAGLGVRWRY